MTNEDQVVQYVKVERDFLFKFNEKLRCVCVAALRKYLTVPNEKLEFNGFFFNPTSLQNSESHWREQYGKKPNETFNNIIRDVAECSNTVGNLNDYLSEVCLLQYFYSLLCSII